MMQTSASQDNRCGQRLAWHHEPREGQSLLKETSRRSLPGRDSLILAHRDTTDHSQPSWLQRAALQPRLWGQGQTAPGLRQTD